MAEFDYKRLTLDDGGCYTLEWDVTGWSVQDWRRFCAFMRSQDKTTLRPLLGVTR